MPYRREAPPGSRPVTCWLELAGRLHLLPQRSPLSSRASSRSRAIELVVRGAAHALANALQAAVVRARSNCNTSSALREGCESSAQVRFVQDRRRLQRALADSEDRLVSAIWLARCKRTPLRNCPGGASKYRPGFHKPPICFRRRLSSTLLRAGCCASVRRRRALCSMTRRPRPRFHLRVPLRPAEILLDTAESASPDSSGFPGRRDSAVLPSRYPPDALRCAPIGAQPIQLSRVTTTFGRMCAPIRKAAAPQTGAPR